MGDEELLACANQVHMSRQPLAHQVWHGVKEIVATYKDETKNQQKSAPSHFEYDICLQVLKPQKIS